MNEMESFLATVPIFQELTPEQLRGIAPLCRQERYAAGTTILSQGGYSEALYFLRSGQLAVRVRRGDHVETVAHLQPPAVFGELSVITGKSCTADVQVAVDAEVTLLPKSAMDRVQGVREKIYLGMTNVLAQRLYNTVTGESKAPAAPLVLLRNLPNWEAPYSFATELGKSLARESCARTLVVNLIEGASLDIRPIADQVFTCSLKVNSVDDSLRADTAQRI